MREVLQLSHFYKGRYGVSRRTAGLSRALLFESRSWDSKPRSHDPEPRLSAACSRCPASPPSFSEERRGGGGWQKGKIPTKETLQPSKLVGHGPEDRTSESTQVALWTKFWQ